MTSPSSAGPVPATTAASRGEAGGEPPDAAKRRGRRPAGEDRRGDILAAARAEFGARGFDATTIRGVARAAGVDPRLVHHYFDGKDALFVAAFELPARPQQLLEGVLGPGADGIGDRLVRLFTTVWDSDEGRQRIVALVSAASASEAGAKMLREFLAREVFARIIARIGSDDAELRAALAASQMMGLAVARYVVRMEPLASADPDLVVALVGPTIQRYLAGPLPAS
jgi:AcrR family transcriptional regulator